MYSLKHVFFLIFLLYQEEEKGDFKSLRDFSLTQPKWESYHCISIIISQICHQIYLGVNDLKVSQIYTQEEKFVMRFGERKVGFLRQHDLIISSF
jgi:hypothetical protein